MSVATSTSQAAFLFRWIDCFAGDCFAGVCFAGDCFAGVHPGASGRREMK